MKARGAALLGVVLAFHAVRSLWRLGTPNVWIDEAATWWGVSGSWGRLLEHVLRADDCGGFLYAVLLKLWTSVAGTSEVALRLPSVACTVLLAAVVFAIGRRLWSVRAGLYGALVIGLYPVVFLVSRQARGYALHLLLYGIVLLGLTLLLRGRRAPGSLTIAGAGSLLVVSHIFGVVALSGAAAVAALGALMPREEAPEGETRRTGSARRLAAALAPFVPPLLVLAGWLVPFWQRVESRRDSFWLDSGWASIGSTYLGLVEYVLPIALAAGALLLTARHATAAEGRTARFQALAGALLALPVLAGPLLATLASRGGHHFVLERYFLPLAVPGALGLGYLLSRLPRRLAWAAAAAILAASMLKPGTAEAYREGTPHGTLSRRAASFLEQEVGGTDAPVLVSPNFQAYALDYYGAPNLAEPADEDHWACEGLREELDALRDRRTPTVWVVHFRCPREALVPPYGRVAGRHRFGPLILVELSLAPLTRAAPDGTDGADGGAGSAPGSRGTPGSPPAGRTTPGGAGPGSSSAPPPPGGPGGAPRS